MIKVTIAKHTEVGGRERNEDCVFADSKDGAYYLALADGLGGHGLGDDASQCCCHVAIKELKSYPQMSNDVFLEIYEKCQNALLSQQEKKNAEGKMRTTLNLLCIQNNVAYWSHVGDSRTYYFKDNQLIKRTFDHSVPQMLAAMGEIEENMIRFHEDRNKLLRVIGAAEKLPKCEIEEPIKLIGNQQFLLCSDGFWELITEEQMLVCLEDADTPKQWIDNMMDIVHYNGKNKSVDNTTVLAAWIEGD